MSRERVSLLAFLVAVVCLVYLILTWHLFAHHPVLIGVQAAAVALMLWARLTFGLRSFHATANTSAGGLVTTGPYRYWRHPIYASIIYFVWAGQVEAPEVRALAVALVASAALVVRMVLEEQFLVATYPEYPAYAARAKRLIPFVY